MTECLSGFGLKNGKDINSMWVERKNLYEGQKILTKIQNGFNLVANIESSTSVEKKMAPYSFSQNLMLRIRFGVKGKSLFRN